MEQHEYRRTPEELAIHAEAQRQGTFRVQVDEILTNSEKRKHLKDNILSQTEIMDALKRRGWPNDKEACDDIGARFGYGAEQIAAASRLWEAAETERGGASVN